MEESHRQSGGLSSPLLEMIRNAAKPFLALAPMIDQSELAFRMLMRELVRGNDRELPFERSSEEKEAEISTRGTGEDGTPLLVCYTPMLWADRFASSEDYRQANFFSNPLDRPLVVQFAGNDPQVLVEAAKKVEDYCDAVDLNLGCPQSTAREAQIGAWMCDDWDLVSRCVKALASNIRVPAFCKMRVHADVEKTLRFALMLQESGCQLLVVHGRTREQERSGMASWEQIKRVKETLRIPVVANGNIHCWSDIDSCYEATGADGVMSAEPSLVDPLNIFGEYAKQRRKRRRSEAATATTTTTPLSNNDTNLPSHGQLDLAVSYLDCVARHPQESNAKRVREHLFHMLGYRQRSFQQFKSKGAHYLQQYMWLNKQVDLRAQLYEAKTIEGLTQGVNALKKRADDQAAGIATPPPTRKRKRPQEEESEETHDEGRDKEEEKAKGT